MSDNNREISYGVDTDEAVAALNRLAHQAADAEDQLIASGQSTKELDKIFRQLDTIIDRVSKKMQSQARATRDNASAARDAAKEYQAYQKIQDGISNARAGDRNQNLSGLIDAGYAAREQEAARFSASLRARLNADVAAERQAANERVKIQREAAREQRRVEQEEQRLRSDINKSTTRIESAESARGYMDEVRALGQIEAARNRVRNATEGVATAERALRQAKTGGDLKQEAQAWRQLADAQEEATRAVRGYDNAQDNAAQGLASQRYALYDVAAAYGAIGAAALGGAAYAITTAASYESTFTQVQRVADTTGSQFDEVGTQSRDLRDDLIGLSTQIPVAFDRIGELAARGKQVGVANDELASFTSTMAQFIAVSDNIDEGSVVETFGRLGDITGVKNYEALASALLAVGDSSAATDQQILNTTQYIMGVASAAGFTADQIIGLSAGIVSLGITQPQGARAGLQGFFRSVDDAIAGVNDKLPNFAKLLGMSNQEFVNLRRSNPAELLLQVTDALSARGGNPDQLRADLVALGVTSNEVSAFFNSMVSQMQKVEDGGGRIRDTLALSAAAMSDSSELARQYSLVLDDLNSQWQIFINNLNALVVTITGGAVPGLAAMFIMVNSVLQGFNQWLGDNQWFASLLQFVGIAITVVGAMATLRAIVALARGSMLAFALIQAQAAAIGVGASGSFIGMAGSLLGVRSAALTASGGLGVFARMAAFAGAIARRVLPILILTIALSGLAKAFKPASSGMDSLQSSTQSLVPAMDDLGGSAGGAGDAIESLGNDAGGGGGSGGGAADKVGKLNKEVRTLVDYGNDLAKVFGRSFDLRFGSSTSQDAIAKQWLSLRDNIEAATAAIEKHRISIAKLRAERNQQAYFAQVAKQYKDELRGAEIRADIAEIDRKLADETKGAAKEQEKLDKGLNGMSSGAIQNRADILSLVGGYQSYIQQLASSGMNQDQLRQKTAELKNQFIAQGVQLGYSRSELEMYAASFDDFIVIIDGVPRDVTVAFNANPALQAMNEFRDQLAATQRAAESAAGGANDALGGIGGGGVGGTGVPDLLAGMEDLLGNTELPPIGIDFEMPTAGEIIASIIGEFYNIGLKIGDWMGTGFNLAKMAIDVMVARITNSDDFDRVATLFLSEFNDSIRRIFGENPFSDFLTSWIKINPETGVIEGTTFGYNVGEGAREGLSGSKLQADQWLDKEIEAGRGRIKTSSNIAGGQIGTSFGLGLNSTTIDTGAWAQRQMVDKVNAKKAEADRAGRGLAGRAGTGFTGTGVSGVDSWTTRTLLSPVSNRGDDAGGRGRALGDRTGRGFTSANGFDTGSWTSRQLLSGIDGQGWSAGEKGRTLGERVVSGMRNGISSTFYLVGNTISSLLSGITVSSGAKTVGGGKKGGFAAGGFTGRGHWLEPAGVVHRGEHVVPKWGTDQRTGLPKPEYMSAVRNGRGARNSSGGYAGGGYVGGQQGAMMVVIDPRQMRQLAGGGPVYATLAETPEQVSGYGDKGRSTGARRGSQR